MFLTVPSTPVPCPTRKTTDPVPHFIDHLGPERLNDYVALHLLVNLELEHKLIIFYCFSMLLGSKA